MLLGLGVSYSIENKLDNRNKKIRTRHEAANQSGRVIRGHEPIRSSTPQRRQIKTNHPHFKTRLPALGLGRVITFLLLCAHFNTFPGISGVILSCCGDVCFHKLISLSLEKSVVTGLHDSVVNHFVVLFWRLYSFAPTSLSLRDFPLLKYIIGGSLNLISLLKVGFVSSSRVSLESLVAHQQLVLCYKRQDPFVRFYFRFKSQLLFCKNHIRVFPVR